MSRRTLSIFLAAGLVASVIAIAPAVGAQAPAIPTEPNIVDPAGDANYLNESMIPGAGHNHTTPADPSTVADLLAVWFSNDESNVSVHFQTEAAPPSTATGVTYQAFTSPGGGEAGSNDTGCLRFLINIPAAQANGGTYQDETWVRLVDRCNSGSSVFNDAIDGEFAIAEGPDGTGITSITFPRSYSPLLANGQVLSSPSATSATPTTGEHTNVGFATPFIDDTEIGSDYAIGGPDEKVKEEPPGKKDPPGKGKKKGCKKGKGKKKGACPGKKNKKKAPEQCAPYQPGDEGAEAETTLVTDEATEEAPIELTFDAPPGMGNDLGLGRYDGTASLYHNVQVDTKNRDAGLFVRYEFPDRHDYDLYLNYPDGSSAAFAGDFNAAPGEGLGSAQGGSSGTNFEQVEGIRTDDCGGYTARLVSYLTTGGETTLKIWLGEWQNEPAAPSGEGLVATVFGLF